MNKLLQVLIAIFVMVGVLTVTDSASASTAKEKIYREYTLPKEVKKFPIKLTNGLTVTTTKSNGKTIPVIKKGTKTIWKGTPLATNSKIRFTVSKNQDTFFYYSQTLTGKKGNVDLIGVSKAGQVFLDETITHDHRLRVDFLSASLIELGMEIDDVGTGVSGYVSQFFQLYKDGTMKNINYFDKTFATLAKKGQLKWTYGGINTTYKNLMANVSYLDGASSVWYFGYYETWKSLYVIDSESVIYKNNKGTIKQNGKTLMIDNRHIVIDVAEAKKLLRQYVGTPLAPFSYEKEYDNPSRDMRDVYNVGKYYLVVEYSDVYSDLIKVSIMTKDMYYIHYYTG